jgi:hypothetical protein
MAEPFTWSSIPANSSIAAVAGSPLTFSGAAWVNLGQTIITNPKTSSWILAFDATIASPVTGKQAYIGVAKSAGNPKIIIGSNYDYNANTQTKMYSLLYGAGPTQTDVGYILNGGRHTYAIAGNGTTIKIVVDGVVVYTFSDLTNAPTDAVTLAGYGTTGFGPYIYRAMVGAPS